MTATATTTERTPLFFDGDPIEKRETELRNKIAKVREMRLHADVAMACLRKYYVDGKADCVEIDDLYGSRVLMEIHVTDFRQIVPLLRSLAAHGYRMRRTVDWLTSRARVYHYGNIEVRAFLPDDDSGVCKRVKVGEETKPVYKFVCPDGETT